jgi:hypothetical protein
MTAVPDSNSIENIAECLASNLSWEEAHFEFRRGNIWVRDARKAVSDFAALVAALDLLGIEVPA